MQLTPEHVSETQFALICFRVNEPLDSNVNRNTMSYVKCNHRTKGGSNRHETRWMMHKYKSVFLTSLLKYYIVLDDVIYLCYSIQSIVYKSRTSNSDQYHKYYTLLLNTSEWWQSIRKRYLDLAYVRSWYEALKYFHSYWRDISLYTVQENDTMRTYSLDIA